MEHHTDLAVPVLRHLAADEPLARPVRIAQGDPVSFRLED